MSDKPRIGGTVATEQDVIDSVKANAARELPNLLFDFSEEPMVSFLVHSPAEAESRYGTRVTFGRLELEVPFEGTKQRFTVLIDNISVNYLRLCQCGAIIERRNNTNHTFNIRAFNIFDLPKPFNEFASRLLPEPKEDDDDTGLSRPRISVRRQRETTT